jgi:hypothetical protein
MKSRQILTDGSAMNSGNKEVFHKAASSKKQRKIGNFIRLLNTFSLHKILQINFLTLAYIPVSICLLISGAFFSPQLWGKYIYSLFFTTIFILILHFSLSIRNSLSPCYLPLIL